MRRPMLLLIVVASCDGSPVDRAVDRGASLASDPGLSDSRFNAFACTTCHAVEPSNAKAYPGAPLGGAVLRPSFWGGRFLTVREAVDTCATRFMRSSPIDPSSRKWLDLRAWLDAIAPLGPSAPQPFTVENPVGDVARGDAASGRSTWDRACRTCHGEPRSGAGRIGAASIVPDDTFVEHGKDGIATVRLVVIEKIRHGGFLGFTGQMPPFSTEALSAREVSDLVSFLALFP